MTGASIGFICDFLLSPNQTHSSSREKSQHGKEISLLKANEREQFLKGNECRKDKPGYRGVPKQSGPKSGPILHKGILPQCLKSSNIFLICQSSQLESIAWRSSMKDSPWPLPNPLEATPQSERGPASPEHPLTRISHKALNGVLNKSFIDGPQNRERSRWNRLQSLCDNSKLTCFCSARLQAGILKSSRCPPEGGRYMNQNRVLIQALQPVGFAQTSQAEACSTETI